MKTNRLLSYIFLAVVYLFPISLLHSENNSIDFSLGFYPGISFGKVSELLYYNNDKTLQSRLDWEIQAPCLNVDASLGYKNFFIFTFANIPLPSRSKEMKDYDWQNYKIYGTKELSYFSCHENFIDYSYSIKADFGYDFKISNYFKFSPLLSLGNESIKFTARNGYIQYPDNSSGKIIWTEDTPKSNIYGDVISYKQDINTAGAGFSMTISPSNFFTFYTAGKINLINYISYDYHILRSIVFADEILIGISFDFQTKTIFKINKNNSITLLYTLEIIPAQKGRSYQQTCFQWNQWKNNGWYKISDQGGLSRYISSISLGYQFTL